ncbi:MAG: hypothetical protein GY832_01465 [Chloroflexi bacterium]|nr:hypothetical protein [Chloroflexota bacterium]
MRKFLARWFPWKIVNRKRWEEVTVIDKERENIYAVVDAFTEAVGDGDIQLVWQVLWRKWFIVWQLDHYIQNIVFSSDEVIALRCPAGIGKMWGGIVKEEYRNRDKLKRQT